MDFCLTFHVRATYMALLLVLKCSLYEVTPIFQCLTECRVGGTKIDLTSTKFDVNFVLLLFDTC